jgi:hypothetical protein
MKSDRNWRVPSVILFLIAVAVGFPYLLLAFAFSPLSGTWLRFVVPLLPFTAVLALWLWSRKPESEGPMRAVNALSPEAPSRGA